MLNHHRVTTVAVLWMTIAYVVCAFFVFLFPGLATSINELTFHMIAANELDRTIRFSLGSVAGLIFWDVVVYLGASLFVWLWNQTNKQ